MHSKPRAGHGIPCPYGGACFARWAGPSRVRMNSSRQLVKRKAKAPAVVRGRYNGRSARFARCPAEAGRYVGLARSRRGGHGMPCPYGGGMLHSMRIYRACEDFYVTTPPEPMAATNPAQSRSDEGVARHQKYLWPSVTQH